MTKIMEQKEEIVMKLVHYFITEEDYEPMIVNGVKNEIWLENMQAKYKIIRINSNYIHNNDQLLADNYKIKNIAKQIKKKTYTFNMKTINLLLDVGDNVVLKDSKNIENYKVDDFKDLRSDDNIAGIFPKIKTMSLKREDSFDTFINITNEINNKSAQNNERFENIFAPKKIIITKVIIAINIITFLLTFFNVKLFNGLLLDILVRNGEYYRLITNIFMHGSLPHLVINMYSLYIIGNQVETFFGKIKYIIIYLINKEASIIFDVVSFGEDLNWNTNEIMEVTSLLCDKKIINLTVKQQNKKLTEYIDINNLYEKLLMIVLEKEDVEEENIEIYNIIEKEFGRPLSPMEYETISDWLNSNINEKLIKAAVKEAVLNGVHRLNYIDKILHEWSKKGYKKPEDVKKIKTKNNDVGPLFEYDWLDENDD